MTFPQFINYLRHASQLWQCVDLSTAQAWASVVNRLDPYYDQAVATLVWLPGEEQVAVKYRSGPSHRLLPERGLKAILRFEELCRWDITERMDLEILLEDA
jgi:hypothetical protein